MATTARYGAVKIDSSDTVASALLTKLNNALDLFDQAVKPSELVSANIPDLNATVQQIVANTPAVWG